MQTLPYVRNGIWVKLVYFLVVLDHSNIFIRYEDIMNKIWEESDSFVIHSQKLGQAVFSCNLINTIRKKQSGTAPSLNISVANVTTLGPRLDILISAAALPFIRLQLKLWMLTFCPLRCASLRQRGSNSISHKAYRENASWWYLVFYVCSFDIKHSWKKAWMYGRNSNFLVLLLVWHFFT